MSQSGLYVLYLAAFVAGLIKGLYDAWARED
jgi:hypothetical protein